MLDSQNFNKQIKAPNFYLHIGGNSQTLTVVILDSLEWRHTALLVSLRNIPSHQGKSIKKRTYRSLIIVNQLTKNYWKSKE